MLRHCVVRSSDGIEMYGHSNVALCDARAMYCLVLYGCCNALNCYGTVW